MKNIAKLPRSLSVGLLSLAFAAPLLAQEGEAREDEEKSGLEEVVVTGSLIPREQTNAGISPITVVTSEDMAKAGLVSIADVMDALTENSGYTEGKSSNLLGRFTTGGQEVNIRGLGTGRTLVLLNGRRIADYPLPFGGEQNGVDVGAIPMSSIARVELLSSGASAIYGSDAVGGVMNFITKRDMEQTEATLTGGMFEDGVGKTLIGSLITGNSFERGSFLVGLDGYVNEQILASDVDWLRKNAPYNASMVSIQRNTPPAPIQSVVPEGSCAPLGFEYDPAFGACNSELSHMISLQPAIRQLSGYFDGRYDLTDNIELFANGIVTTNEYESRSNALFWDGVVVRDDFSSATFLTRAFSDDELGSSDIVSSQDMWTATVGAKGGLPIGEDAWQWDLSWSHASYRSRDTSVVLKEEGIRNWILSGAETMLPDTSQQYTYIVDSGFYDNQLIDNIVRPVQASDIDALTGENVLRAKASSDFLTLTLNGALGDWGFLYKPARFALRSEIARQTTEIIPDERSQNTEGEGWYNIGAIQSKGSRDRKALALELALPVLSNLDLSLAGRVDHYNDSSSISGRSTGQVKFLYRATDWLKFRGGYSQTFRAPDMFNLYGVSEGFQTVPDFSAPGCFDGEVFICNFTNVGVTREPDTGLGEEHGDDLGFGFIWQPLPNLLASIDWYRIKLEDLVVTESPYDLLLREWQCDNGELEGSPQLCADVQSRIRRNSFGAVEHITVQPINQDSLVREGIDLRAEFTYESEKLGVFTTRLNYSKVLKHELTSFEGDEPIDLRYGWQGQSTPENSTSLLLGWDNPISAGKSVGVNLFMRRDGGIYNFTQTQMMKPFYSVNLTTRYQFNARTQASLIVQNLLYTSPQDTGGGFWPGYWVHLQNSSAVGRGAFLTLQHSFN